MNAIIIKLAILLFSVVTTETGNFRAGSTQPSCTDCHSDLVSGTIKHPDIENSCDLCHNPTGDEHPGGDSKGFSLTDNVPALCYMCHDNLGEMEHVHYPVEEGGCSNCHSFHSSDRKGLILDDLSENICLDCHDTDTGDNPLIHSPVRQGKCMECHNPHQSGTPGILIKDIQGLCTGCHRGMVSGKTSIHAPAESGECLVCHKAHSSENSSLLTISYPAEFYTEASNNNFELCFQCHDSELMLSETTLYSTNFRDGEKNLHYLHINGEKGRNCTVCHDMHASDLPYILKSKIQFGKWTMPVSYTATASGGSCNTGCHSPKGYSRD